jgi:tRNA-Thr(GGU) m(6)t(6)A37 methyltransferase TsaA
LSFQIDAIGEVQGSRTEAEDDYWGGARSSIVLRDDFDADALDGIETFSHVEILFLFNRVDPDSVVCGARHPRNNLAWPAVGIFAQRGKKRPNRIGSTICRVLQRNGRQLEVAELDAIEGTPVIDIKPVMQEFLPRGAIEQPAWSSELMRAYWLPYNKERSKERSKERKEEKI